jgi:hypothetical protein
MLEMGIWSNDTIAQWLSRYARLTPHKPAMARGDTQLCPRP